MRILCERFPGNREMIEELTQEARGLAWKAYLSIIDNGKQPDDYPAVIAYRACQAALKGRKTAAQEKSTSISNPQTQAKQKIQRMPLDRQAETVLQRKAPPAVPDQVAFEIDYSEWLAKQGTKGPIIDGMVAGETTQNLAGRFGKSPGRISQIRREAYDDWTERSRHDESPGKDR